MAVYYMREVCLRYEIVQMSSSEKIPSYVAEVAFCYMRGVVV